MKYWLSHNKDTNINGKLNGKDVNVTGDPLNNFNFNYTDGLNIIDFGTRYFFDLSTTTKEGHLPSLFLAFNMGFVMPRPDFALVSSVDELKTSSYQVRGLNVSGAIGLHTDIYRYFFFEISENIGGIFFLNLDMKSESAGNMKMNHDFVYNRVQFDFGFSFPTLLIIQKIKTSKTK